jgi:hypothetical protein
MRSFLRKPARVTAVCWLALALFACSKSHRGGPQGQDGSNPNLVVEGYIEFPGPHAKWAGPQTFVIHLSTWETNDPVVSITPPFVASSTSAGSPESPVPASTQLTLSEVREDLSRLRAVVTDPMDAQAGCLSPVRVRLIQADGVLLERQACRGQKGWPRIASEIANEVMEDQVLVARKNHK